MRTFKYILNFNLKYYNYHIPNTNTQLSHLLVIVANSTRVIFQRNDYRTSSPTTNASIILSRGHNGSETRLVILKIGKITNYRDFMTQASFKFYKLRNSDTG